MIEYPFYDTYLKQGSKCSHCGREIASPEYCVINTPAGVKVIHGGCLREVKVGGCQAQIEILVKRSRL